MTTVDTLLIRGAVQVALFTLAALGVYFAARRLGPRAAVNLLLWSMMLVLGLTALTISPWPHWRFEQAEAASVTTTPTATTDADVSLGQMQETPLETTAVETTPFTLADYSSAFFNALTEPQPAPVAAEQTSWSLWISLVALTGVVLGVARLAYSLATITRLDRESKPVDCPTLSGLVDEARTRLGVSQQVMLRESPTIATPATIGWRRPTILLPSGWQEWTDAEQQAVIAHELAHIASGDFFAWVVARVAVAVHFYNPLVRWLAARLQLEQELAADQTAASLTGDSQEYLKSLASLALATPPHRLAGPARTLIPSRSLLMRRVEMLRSPLSHIASRPIAARLRWASGVLLVLLAIGVAGLRAPTTAFAEERAPVEYITTDLSLIPLDLAPKQTILATSIQPGQLIKDKRLDQLRELLGPEFTNLPRVERAVIEGISEYTMFVSFSDASRVVFRFIDQETCQKGLKLVETAKGKLQRVEGAERPTWENDEVRVVQWDDQTMVCDQRSTISESPFPPLQGNAPHWIKSWNNRQGAVASFACNSSAVKAKLSPQNLKELPGGFPIQMISSILEHVTASSGRVTVDENLTLTLTSLTADDQGAQQVAGILNALVTLGKNIVAAQQSALEAETARDNNRIELFGARRLVKLVAELLDDSQVVTNGPSVTLTCQHDADELARLAVSLIPPIEAARQAARRAQSTNNLRHLALAMHTYHNAYGHFPAGKNYDYFDRETSTVKKSTHPHSWRVALLPYLEQHTLYNSYRFDEPWDSEANKRIMKTNVPVLRDPKQPGSSTSAAYFVLTGPKTMFPDGPGLSFKDIRDGTSKTLMFVEAKRDIPWTKPEDIAVDPGRPLPAFGGHFDGYFLAALADGSVHTVMTPIANDLLYKMITRDGREVFQWPPQR